MICRLCLKDNGHADFIRIFDEVGVQLQMSAVLAKFFWFEPKVDDPISTAVCKICWQKVSDFNDFYAEVEESHRLLTERFFFNKTLKIGQKKQIPVQQLDNINELQKQEEKEKEYEEQTTHFDSEAVELQYNFVDEDDDDDYDDDDVDNDNNEVESKSEQEIIKNEKNETTIVNSLNEIEIDLTTELFELEDFNKNAATSTDATNSSKQQQQNAEIKDETPVKSSRITRSKTKSIQDVAKNIANTNTHTQLPIKKKDKKFKETTKKKNRYIRTRKKVLNDLPNSSFINLKSLFKKTHNAKNIVKEKTSINNVDSKIANYLFCEICNWKPQTFSELRKHIEEKHKHRGYAICCGKKFYKRVLLADHIEKHLNPNCYSCDACNKVFSDRQCMRNHFLIKHQPDENKTFQCKKCPKKFVKLYLLEQHKVIHDDRRYLCSLCEKAFPTIGQLTTHNKSVHGNNGIMCEICAKVLRGKSAFDKHMLEHQGIIAPKVQCDSCGSWHKDKYSLQKHKRRHNEEGILHVCDICGKSAPNRSAMLSHQRYVHALQRIFDCSVCKKSFKKSINLKEHMATHTGEVLYKCPHCTKTFNSNANMHSHRKKTHPQEFEETRKKRNESRANNSTTTITTTASQTNIIKADTIRTTKAQIEKTADDAEVITINTYADNGERQSLLLKATKFDAVDDDDNDDEEGANSIIFTVQ